VSELVTKGDFARLQRGDALEAFELSVTHADVQDYLEATGERNPLWDTYIPPLALGAFALGGLMDRIQVPEALIHTGQEYAFREAVPIGSAIDVRIHVVSISERRGAVMAVFATELRVGDTVAGTGRTTVMIGPPELVAPDAL
jgi:hypothetical protein